MYFKIPLVQNVRYFERRNLTLDNAEPDRITTSEKKPLLVDFIVLWRIIDVAQYYRSVGGDEEAARRRLSQTVRSNLAEEFNKRTVNEAISTRARPDHAASRARRPTRTPRSIGVEVVDVRLRRLELPPDVTGPVYQRMESERRRVANELRSLGGAESERIRADADRQRQVILAEAYSEAQKIKGDGDAKAVGDLRERLLGESGVLQVLPQPRGLQRVVPQPQRHDGARSDARSSSSTSGSRAAGAKGATPR